jgi:hypothetical protein
VTEDHYFHLSKADLVELEMSHKGGLAKWLQRIVAEEDGAKIVAEFKNLILTSYGVKSEDGRRFIKNDALREEFVSSEAYSTLFIELCTDAGAAAAFVNGIVPAGLEQDVEQMKIGQEESREHPSDPAATPAEPRWPGAQLGDNPPEAEVPDPTAVEPRLLTRAELTEMDDGELRAGLADGRYKLS